MISVEPNPILRAILSAPPQIAYYGRYQGQNVDLLETDRRHNGLFDATKEGRAVIVLTPVPRPSRPAFLSFLRGACSRASESAAARRRASLRYARLSVPAGAGAVVWRAMLIRPDEVSGAGLRGGTPIEARACTAFTSLEWRIKL